MIANKPALTSRFYRRHRTAVTLIELLVVMGVVVLLAGLTLPTVRSILKDRRVTECARIFQSAVESARAKSVYTGRPVALILERLPANGGSNQFNQISDNTCMRISIGEVFPPYEGDWTGATGTVSGTPPNLLTIPLAKVASLFDPTTGNPTQLIQSGDILQFGEHAQRFSISTITRFGSAPNYEARISFQNPPTGFSEAQWTITGETRFRIYRAPTKSIVGAISLPKGTCIDLTQSGVGGSQLQTLEVPSRAASGPFSNLSVIFNSRGGIDGSYYFNYGVTPSLQAQSPTGLYYFLVGRPDQVVPAGTPAGAVSSRDGFKPNLEDTSNLWVTLNPHSGFVYTAQNYPSVVSPLPGQQLSVARTLASQAAVNGKN